MKKITFNIDFELPNEYKFIAQDANGLLYAYVNNPVISEESGHFYIPKNNSEILLVYGAPNPNWKESLREI